MESSAKKSLLWVATAVLLYVFLSAVRHGAAELFSLYAREDLGIWSSRTYPPSLLEVEDASRLMEAARFLVADNPDHLEDMARLYLVRASLVGVSPSERQSNLLSGLTEVRQAISLRPVSAYSWMILSMLKRELGEFDAEFRNALQQAVVLGPWEPEVQQSIADVGLSAWAALPKPEQELVRNNFVRGMKHQSREMLAIVQAHQNDCADVDEHGQLKAGCR